METVEIANSRLNNQHISYSFFSEPARLVEYLCCVQAQDFPNAKWGMGVRIPGINESKIDKAIADFSLVRTWLFRGTLHIVSADDIHWLLGLLSERLILAGKSRNRQLGVDEAMLKKSQKLIGIKLRDGKAHTRDSIKEYLNNNGIQTPDNILAHILQYSALQSQIVFGPREGSQFTFVLFETLKTKNQKKSREEALSDLAFRYFRSHGPATIKDFTWWSGLTLTEAKKAIEIAKSKLISESQGENVYWMATNSGKIEKKNQLYLLPAFDSYLLAYRDRSIFLDDLNTSKVISTNGIFRPIIVHEGKIVGIWKKIIARNQLILETSFFKPPKKYVIDELSKKADHFAKYLNKDLAQVTTNDKIVYKAKNV